MSPRGTPKFYKRKWLERRRAQRCGIQEKMCHVLGSSNGEREAAGIPRPWEPRLLKCNN
jgi:hypothetical protein